MTERQAEEWMAVLNASETLGIPKERKPVPRIAQSGCAFSAPKYADAEHSDETIAYRAIATRHLTTLTLHVQSCIVCDVCRSTKHWEL